MNSSQKFWNTYPLEHGQDEFFKQVGKTVQGQPISSAQFQQILNDISHCLDLKPSDDVLDLCCGNGLITQEIAVRCRSMIGVDFSQPLIATAEANHQPPNTRYMHGSVTELLGVFDKGEISVPQFNKIYMYEALQHLAPSDWESLLQSLLSVSTEDVVMLFASVPDDERIDEFYNTPERKLAYESRKRSGTDSMGTWWRKDFIQTVCGKLGLRCEFKNQDSVLHTSHYRFDLVVYR